MAGKEELFSQKKGQVPAPKIFAKSEDGRFLKYTFIASGTFKDVYRGWDNVEKRHIAWCEMKLDGSDKQKVMEEIKMLQRINNPHVLQLFDSWEHTEESGRKTMVLATELMTGTLKQHGRRPSAVIRNLGRQILKGLDALHTHQPRPIIHRDLKCSNIFIDKASGIVKIGDLGLARLMITTNVTKTKLIGTVGFMAPEIIKGDGKYNEQVDIYSFGMCLLELSTGEDPYEAEYGGSGSKKQNQLYIAVLNNELKPPQVLKSITDGILKDVITGCIKFDPKERYTVKQLLSHEFFLINEKDVQETHSYGETALMKIQNGSIDTICYGIGEVETDSGISTLDSRYSTDASDKTVIEEVNKGEIQADDGARVNPDTLDTRHSIDVTNKTEERLGPVARVNQHQSPPSQNPPTPNNVKPIGLNESVMFDSVQPSTLKDENSLVTLKTPEASFVAGDTSASKEVYIKPNKEYDCWRKNVSDVFNLLGEANFPSAAGLLYEKYLISSELYDNIVTPRTGLSEREQITLLLNIIERKLKDTDRVIVEETWKAFTSAVGKIGYKKYKADLEFFVNEKPESELEAFKHYEKRLCLQLQSSVLPLADQLWSAFVITDEEKSQVMNGTFHYYQKWMRNMKEEIGKHIKEDPTVFYTVKETLKGVDGLKKAIDKYLTL